MTSENKPVCTCAVECPKNGGNAPYCLEDLDAYTAQTPRLSVEWTPFSTVSLKPLVVRLAEARKIAKMRKAVLEERRQDWMRDNLLVIQAVDEAVKQVQELEADIKARAVIAYNESGQPDVKDLGHGVKIRIVTALEYEVDKAFSWAVEHNLCLALDRKAFETVAERQHSYPGANLDFVIIKKGPEVTIANDLSTVLEEKP